MLKVQLFGQGQAWYAGHSLVGFPGGRCHGLLCYLMLNRHRPHARERLAAVFWADYPTSSSRTCLRNTLWRLRQTLEAAGAPADDYLLVDDGSLSFPGLGCYWLDVEVFEEAVAGCQGLPGNQLAPHQAKELEGAVDLYSGDLLDGTYDDWCLYDRERLRLLHLSTLDKLLVYHEHAGSYERGLDYGQQILARDPTREKVHRQMMRLYWLMDRHCDALAQYRRCAQVLRDELDAPPTAKTKLLYEQMLQNRFEPGRSPVYRRDRLPLQLGRAASIQAVTEQALERVRQLRTATENTGAELDLLERLMQSVLVEVGRGSRADPQDGSSLAGRR